MTPAQMSLKLLTPSSRDNRDVADEMETSLWLSRWPCVEPQVSREGGGRTFVPGRGAGAGRGRTGGARLHPAGDAGRGLRPPGRCGHKPVLMSAAAEVAGTHAGAGGDSATSGVRAASAPGRGGLGAEKHPADRGASGGARGRVARGISHLSGRPRLRSLGHSCAPPPASAKNCSSHLMRSGRTRFLKTSCLVIVLYQYLAKQPS